MIKKSDNGPHFKSRFPSQQFSYCLRDHQYFLQTSTTVFVTLKTTSTLSVIVQRRIRKHVAAITNAFSIIFLNLENPPFESKQPASVTVHHKFFSLECLITKKDISKYFFKTRYFSVFRIDKLVGCDGMPYFAV